MLPRVEQNELRDFLLSWQRLPLDPQTVHFTIDPRTVHFILENRKTYRKSNDIKKEIHMTFASQRGSIRNFQEGENKNIDAQKTDPKIANVYPTYLVQHTDPKMVKPVSTKKRKERKGVCVGT